jgi:transcription elongation factor Elf1
MTGYYCNICGKDHQLHSKIGQEHYPDYLKWQDAEDKKAEEKRKTEIAPTEEETKKKLYKAIFD